MLAWKNTTANGHRDRDARYQGVDMRWMPSYEQLEDDKAKTALIVKTYHQAWILRSVRWLRTVEDIELVGWSGREDLAESHWRIAQTPYHPPQTMKTSLRWILAVVNTCVHDVRNNTILNATPDSWSRLLWQQAGNVLEQVDLAHSARRSSPCHASVASPSWYFKLAIMLQIDW